MGIISTSQGVTDEKSKTVLLNILVDDAAAKQIFTTIAVVAAN